MKVQKGSGKFPESFPNTTGGCYGGIKISLRGNENFFTGGITGGITGG